MAHERIGSRADDLLSLLHFDDARGVAVGAQNEDVQAVSRQHAQVGEDDEPDRHLRPAVAIVEARQEENDHKVDRRGGDDEPLPGARLACARAPFEQGGVALDKIDQRDAHRDEERRQPGPGLPVIERPCGPEQTGADDYDA